MFRFIGQFKRRKLSPERLAHLTELADSGDAEAKRLLSGRRNKTTRDVLESSYREFISDYIQDGLDFPFHSLLQTINKKYNGGNPEKIDSDVIHDTNHKLLPAGFARWLANLPTLQQQVKGIELLEDYLRKFQGNTENYLNYGLALPDKYTRYYSELNNNLGFPSIPDYETPPEYKDGEDVPYYDYIGLSYDDNKKQYLASSRNSVYADRKTPLSLYLLIDKLNNLNEHAVAVMEDNVDYPTEFLGVSPKELYDLGKISRKIRKHMPRKRYGDSKGKLVKGILANTPFNSKILDLDNYAKKIVENQRRKRR